MLAESVLVHVLANAAVIHPLDMTQYKFAVLASGTALPQLAMSAQGKRCPCC